MKDYQTARNTRRESLTVVDRFRGGKLVPVMAVPIRPNEGGMLSQSITMELDPVAGRLLTPVYGELTAVFVPVQAIDALKEPAAAYAGMTEVLREKLLAGNPLFVMEGENEITKRCGITPKSIGGVKMVSQTIGIAHNAAVNHLRQMKYVKAPLLTHVSRELTRALISSTVLQRLNGVLDPEDRINGAVQLALPAMRLPVDGIGVTGSPAPVAMTARETDGGTFTDGQFTSTTSNAVAVKLSGTGATALPAVYAQLNATTAGNVALSDFYNAEKMDALVRTMRDIVDKNPQYGEEMVLRWSHGLSVDPGKVPFVMAEKRQQFGRDLVPSMDTIGVQTDYVRSDMALQMGFTVPIPRTELGGVIITFACLKPDETLANQPHPIFADNWGLDNFVADELAIDPVPVTMRELNSEVAAGSENTIAFYTGLNALKQAYVSYGFSRNLDKTKVANKTAVWQLEIPLSVTPDSILYPADLSHYPFADSLAEVCTYSINSNAVIQTPMIFGPTPVEELAIIETENLFKDL